MSELQTQPQVIEVGGHNYTIRPFKGSKGLRAMAIVSQLSGKIRPIMREMGEFQTEYRSTNFLRITRDLAETRVIEAKAQKDEYEAWIESQVKDDLFKTQDEERIARSQMNGFMSRVDTWQGYLDGPLRDRDYLDIPQSPSGEEMFMAVFPTVFNYAERQVLQIIGLLLVEDSTLKQWRDSGPDLSPDDGPSHIEQELVKFGEEITDELDLDEVAEMVVVAVEIMATHYKDKADRLGKRLRKVRDKFRTIQEEEMSPTTPKIGTLQKLDSEETNNDSSTSSPEPTDGIQTEPSSKSSGETSSPSMI